MKRAVLLLLLVVAVSCAGGRGVPASTSVAGHGAISIAIVPNPVVATRVSGNTYDFPFEVVIRETGGRPVDVSRVSATVFAIGGIQIATETYDAAKINQLGYSTHVPANGELRYRFNPRREVSEPRLFTGVSADIRVDAVDDTGTPATAGTRVSVTHT
jgi:hypothetical protein